MAFTCSTLSGTRNCCTAMRRSAARARSPCKPRRGSRWRPRRSSRGRGSIPSAQAGRRGPQPAEGTLAVVNVYDSLKPWPGGHQDQAVAGLPGVADDGALGQPAARNGLADRGGGRFGGRREQRAGHGPGRGGRQRRISSPRPTRNCFSRPWTSKGWPCSRCVRPPTCTKASTWCARVATNRSTAARRLMKLDRWPSARPPSRITPDVDGSNPFSYPRLVQPVLDRTCVDCHAKHADKAPNLGRSRSSATGTLRMPTWRREYGFHDYGSRAGDHAGKVRRPGLEAHRDPAERATTASNSRPTTCTGSRSGWTVPRCFTASTRKKAAKRSFGARSPGPRYSRVGSSAR